jgi:hypothetical protein
MSKSIHPDILTAPKKSDDVIILKDIISNAILEEKPVTTEQAKMAYPNITMTSNPTTDTSLAAQVKRQFKNGTARHITNNTYRLTLSKQQHNMTRYDLEKELKVLNLKPKQIQYIEQTTLGNIVINLTVSKYMIKKWTA